MEALYYRHLTLICAVYNKFALFFCSTKRSFDETNQCIEAVELLSEAIF